MAIKQYHTQVKISVWQVREATGPQVKSGKDFADMFSDIVDMAQEAFFVVTLDQKNKVIDKRMVSLGTLTASLVHPREVYRPALIDSAAAVAFVHHHPSGDCTPSPEDHSITKQLVEAGKILGIRVLDHVVVSRNGYYSFVDNNQM